MGRLIIIFLLGFLIAPAIWAIIDANDGNQKAVQQAHQRGIDKMDETIARYKAQQQNKEKQGDPISSRTAR